jgi:hypothetical protein
MDSFRLFPFLAPRNNDSTEQGYAQQRAMLVMKGRPGNPGTAFIQEMIEYIQQRQIILCLAANKSLKSGRSGINRLPR